MRQSNNAQHRSASVGPFIIELLPCSAYEASYTPEQSVIGYAFDTQVGIHAFASDQKKTFRAMANGLAWTPAGCEIYSQSSGGEYLKISGSPLATRIDNTERHFNNYSHPIATQAAFTLRRALLSVTPVDPLACEESLIAMESCVSDFLSAPTPSVAPAAWMNAHRFKHIEEYIEAHLDEALSVHELAQAFQLSAGFFAREFKRSCARSPHQFIVDKRLARARQYLHQSHLDLSTIAFNCGFSSHSHMTAQFRTRLGLTPTQLRHASNRF